MNKHQKQPYFGFRHEEVPGPWKQRDMHHVSLVQSLQGFSIIPHLHPEWSTRCSQSFLLSETKVPDFGSISAVNEYVLTSNEGPNSS